MFRGTITAPWPQSQGGRVQSHGGWLSIRLGDFVYAMWEFEAAQSAGFDSPEMYWGLGIVMHKLYPNRKVFEVCFRRAVAQLTAQPGRDDLYRFYSDYCRALEERGRFAEAIEMGRKSVALFDGHAKAHRCLARAYLGLGDERRAAPHLDFVDRASPNEKRLIEQWGEK